MNSKSNSTTIHIGNNSLSLVRMIAAFSVMFGHAWRHLDVTIPNSIKLLVGFFNGVPIFFFISGFLIWRSIETSGNFRTYFLKRFMRIYPELWVSVLVEIIALFFFYDEVSRGGYKLREFHGFRLALFIVAQATIFQFWTPSFLRDYGCGTPNGALWTIGVIVQAYVFIYIYYKLLKKRKITVWIAHIVCWIIIAIAIPMLSDVLPSVVFKLINQTIIPYYWLFLIGAFLMEHFQLVDTLKNIWFVLLLISAFVFVNGIDIIAGSYGLLRHVFLLSGILGFAFKYPSLSIPVDFSYEIYLYHMTVINILIQVGCYGTRPCLKNEDDLC